MVKASGLTALLTPHSVEYRAERGAHRVRFVGARSGVVLRGVEPMPGAVNFLVGSPDRWRAAIPTYSGVEYRGLYAGIDLRYSTQGSELKSEFTIASGADPFAIRFVYEGGERPRVLPDGSLSIAMAGEEIRERAPVAFQDVDGRRVGIPVRFTVADNGEVSFAVGAWDPSLPLVIDPVVAYSSLFGGRGMDTVYGIAADASGNAYIAGRTDSYDLPFVVGLQGSSGGGSDAFVAKVNPSGNALVYCTYVGGSGDDRAYAVAIDTAGSAYVTGTTYSRNFPVVNALQSRLGGTRNAFVIKLSATGGAPVFSTYLGGAGTDQGNAIAIDPSGYVYVAGDTTSTNFPATGYQSSSRGQQDGFVVKLSANGRTQIYGTYLGGYATDHVAALAVDSGGSVVVTGSTYSSDFPVTNGLRAYAGRQDAFVTRLNSSGSALLFSTCLGGSGGGVGSPEEGRGVALDSSGAVYVVGVAGSTDFPLVQPQQSALLGSSDAFLAVLTSAGALSRSTLYGGAGIDAANAVVVDSSGRVFVVGETTSADFPLQSAAQTRNNGDYDAFVLQLSAGGASIAYSSYLGGSGSDSALAVALDAAGNVYVGGQTLSTDFPVSGGFQTTNPGNFGGFVAKLVFTSGASPTGLSPSSGSGASQTFRAQYTADLGASTITTASLLLNTSAQTAGGCAVVYDRAQNRFTLLTDAGGSSGTSFAPGASGTSENSQCVFNAVSSAASLADKTLTLDISLTFKVAFVGAKTIFLQSANSSGSSGWQSLGSWTVSSSTPTVDLAFQSINPSSGTGADVSFAVRYTDPPSPGAINEIWLWVAASFTPGNGSSACIVRFQRTENRIYVIDNAGVGWTDGIAPGASATAANSRCSVNGGASSMSVSGTVLTLTLSLSFPSTFSGAKNVYAYAATSSANVGWSQVGSWTVPGSTTPVVSFSSLTPSSGSGVQTTFTAKFSDTLGAADVSEAWLWIAASLTPGDGSSACIVRYNRGANAFYLVDNAGSGWSAGAAPGAATTLSNNRCSLAAATSIVASSGTNFTMSVALTFASSFAGSRNIWASATGGSTESGWQAAGSWTVPASTAPTVSLSSLTPSSGSGLQATFAAKFSDTLGGSDVAEAWLWIAAAFTPGDGTSACLLRYDRGANAFYLIDNAGSGWSGGAAPGAGATLSNNRCGLAAANSSVSSSGTDFTITVALTFASSFAGAKNIWAYASGGSANSGWQAAGSWTVPGSTAPAVSLSSLTPSSGSGLQATLAAKFSDTLGAADVREAWLWIAAAFTPGDGTSACILRYDRTANAFYLIDTAGSGWSTGAAPGSSTTLSNNRCSLTAANSGASSSGTDFTLTVALTFASGFAGAKNIWAYAAGSSANSGWQAGGGWTVSAPSAGVSVSGAISGSSATSSLPMVVTDSAGANDVSEVWGWVAASFTPGDGAAACIFRYDRSSGLVFMLDDSGANWLVPATLASSATIENSRCVLDLSRSSAVASGSTLNVTIGMTFKTAFAGAKVVYGYAAGSSANSGWKQLGTWTVPGAASSTVRVSSYALLPGSGTSGSLAITASDTLGYADIAEVWLWLAAQYTPDDASAACVVRYNGSTFSLYNDAGSSWLSASPGVKVSNSRCSITGAVSKSGNDVALTVQATFTTSFKGSKAVYAYAAGAGGNSGWQQIGTWTIP